MTAAKCFIIEVCVMYATSYFLYEEYSLVGCIALYGLEGPDVSEEDTASVFTVEE
jgi:hypothetical protein